MKSKVSFVIVYFWLLILFVFGVVLFCFAEKEERISEQEKRMLSGFPEMTVENILYGDFSSDFENYLSDGVWGRDSIVGASESILRFFSMISKEEQIMLDEISMSDELQGNTETDSDDESDLSQPGTETDEDISDDEPESSPAVPESEDGTDGPKEVASMDGYGLWLERKEGYYVQTLFPKESHIQSAAHMLNAFRSFTPDDGNVFYVCVPMQNTAALLCDPNYNGWVENISEGIQKYADDGVYAIDVPSILEDDIKAMKHIYFASDHHWTPLAASELANECLRIQGLPVIPFDDYQYTIGTFANAKLNAVDDLYLPHTFQRVVGNQLPNGKVGEEIKLIDYEGNSYMAYLHGDSTILTKFITGFSTGRNALVVGDSFSNCFLPYLVPYYDEVSKIDARNYDPEVNGGSISDLMNEHEIDDVYIVVSYATGVTSKVTYYDLENALYG